MPHLPPRGRSATVLQGKKNGADTGIDGLKFFRDLNEHAGTSAAGFCADADPWVPRRLVTHGYCCFGATRHNHVFEMHDPRKGEKSKTMEISYTRK